MQTLISASCYLVASASRNRTKTHHFLLCRTSGVELTISLFEKTLFCVSLWLFACLCCLYYLFVVTLHLWWIGCNFHQGHGGHVPPLFKISFVSPLLSNGFIIIFLTASCHCRGGAGHRQPLWTCTLASCDVVCPL